MHGTVKRTRGGKGREGGCKNARAGTRRGRGQGRGGKGREGREDGSLRLDQAEALGVLGQHLLTPSAFLFTELGLATAWPGSR